MTLEFDILFTVSFRHAYFSSARLECLTVAPDAATGQALKNHGLLFKPFKNSFQVFYDTALAGRKRKRAELLEGKLQLRFILSLNDPHFYNYTEIVTNNLKEVVFYFNNSSTRNAAGKPYDLLHDHEFVTEKDLVTPEAIGENFFVKPFGVLDIQVSPALKLEYSIHFNKKTSYWRYIVVGDHLKGLNNPAILNMNDQAVFNSPEKIELPDRREALLFTSLAPISLAEIPGELFQLVENYDFGAGRHKVVKKALPVPDIRSVSSGSGKNKTEQKTNYSEIFIY
jgi:hypothetical protein